MIGDWLRVRSLRAILLLSFVVVAGSGVALLGVASWLSAEADSVLHEQQEQSHTADHVARAAAAAYLAAEGWRGADLGEAAAVAAAGGGRVAVMNQSGQTVPIVGPGADWMAEITTDDAADGQTNVATAAVIVENRRVGSVAVRFGARPAEIEPVSMGWIGVAATVAGVVALVAAVLLARRLVIPLDRLIGTTRSFAAGDRSARARVDAPGELGQLARDFDAMADEIDRIETHRRQLAADVAHELRTPLTVLQAGLEEVRDGYVPADRQTLARLHRQSVQLGRIVADLGELAAPDPPDQDVHRVPVDLERVVGDEAEARGLLAAEAQITLSTAAVSAVVVLADPDRLHQIVGNILTNALTYCHRGDRVALASHVSGGMGEFICADTGPGIAVEQLPRVFDRRWRGDTGGKSGSGLGLAVAKKLVEANGGDIEVLSDGRSGTTVKLRLPLAAGG